MGLSWNGDGINPLSIYRRSDLWIRQEFESDFSGNKNTDLLRLELNNFEQKNIVQDDVNNIQYTALKSIDGKNSGYVDVNVAYKPNTVHEIQFDYYLVGPGKLEILKNDAIIDTIEGPCPWKSTIPHRLITGDSCRLRYTVTGDSDPAPHCEIDNICVYYYDKVDSDFVNYQPPSATAQPVTLNILRGYNVYQTMQLIGAEIQTDLRFYTAPEHDLFISNGDRVHVVIDDKGDFYRGVLTLGKCKMIAPNQLYEQSITFDSPYLLGKGWL